MLIQLPVVYRDHHNKVVAISPDWNSYTNLTCKLYGIYYSAGGLLNGQIFDPPSAPTFDHKGPLPNCAYIPHNYQVLSTCYQDEVETMIKLFRILKVYPDKPDYAGEVEEDYDLVEPVLVKDEWTPRRARETPPHLDWVNNQLDRPSQLEGSSMRRVCIL